ncbi:MAG TPA: type VI secretion system protein TssA [Enterobacteriaceae bacterium]|nr:type VI secretion system protein TssA [Enterobacteriaceae bacterium]
MEHRHPWCQRLLTPLSAEAAASPIAGDDPLWEKVETEMVKIGSLAHGQINLNDVAENCLLLLESKTKDMRVLVQMLRCLQHPAKATPFATALMLLDCWVSAFWTTAWPASGMQKQRLMVQIIKRFAGASERMSEQASGGELSQIITLAEQFSETWLQAAPDKGDLLDELILPLRRVRQRQQEQAKANEQPASVAATPLVTTRQSAGAVEIDTSNERGWRQTLLKVADTLTEQQPEQAMGYRLRRHAIWHSITAPPGTSRGNKTQLAPVSADRVSEYDAALAQVDIALWKQIEQSLTLSPYWFEGHWFSARAAGGLGYADVAAAIADELNAFLQRLGTLKTLAFSDGTPFLPPACEEWLRESQGQSGGAGQAEDLAGDVRKLLKDKGLNAALALLEDRSSQQSEPRDRFYAGLMLADLLAADGMKALAGWHYQQLWQESQRLGLAQWEPGLVKRLERSARIRG